MDNLSDTRTFHIDLTEDLKMLCAAASTELTMQNETTLVVSLYQQIGYSVLMRRDHRLSRMLHVLIHMGDRDTPLPSPIIAQMLGTAAPIVRRTMGTLREQGLVTSATGKGGGWMLTRPLEGITMLDVYQALGHPALFAVGPASDNPSCLVERAVDARLGDVFAEARTLLHDKMQATTLSQIAADFRANPAHPSRRACGSSEKNSTG